MLGLYVQNDKIILKPKLPSYWDFAQIEYKYKSSVYYIKINNKHKGESVKSVVVDGVLQKDNVILLTDDKNSHTVEVDI
jgi:cellobiose phosphorylase